MIETKKPREYDLAVRFLIALRARLVRVNDDLVIGVLIAGSWPRFLMEAAGWLVPD